MTDDTYKYQIKGDGYMVGTPTRTAPTAVTPKPAPNGAGLSVRIELRGPHARAPAYKTPGAAGADLCAAIATERWLHVGQRMVIDTGVCVEIPPGYEGQVRSRSGLFRDHGIRVVCAAGEGDVVLGTIDSDYRGPIGVALINHGDVAWLVQPGDRIAQLVIAPVAHAAFEVVGQLAETTRGEGGFGSTGVR